MNTLNRTSLVAATFALAAAGALTMVSSSAFAAPAVDAEAHAAHVERMNLIGRTARYDELPAADVTVTEPTSPAAREQAWAERMALAGHTVKFGETAPAPVSADRTPATDAERAEAYVRRMALAGRTVQPSELLTLRATPEQQTEVASRAIRSGY